MKSTFSVIMPAYNAELYIKEAIRSVLNQTYPYFDLIIVDDGSTDETFNICSSFNDDRIKIIRQNNKGLGGARNAGISAAENDYIAFLDSDDIWSEYKLQNIASNLDDNVGIYYSNVMQFKNSIVESVPNRYTEPIYNMDKKMLILIFDFIVISSAVVPKNILKEFYGFAEDLNGTEDWDLWIRIGQKYQFKKISTYDCYYRINENGLSKQREEFLKKEYAVIKKHLLSNSLGTSKIKKLALWVWYKKNFYYYLLNKKLTKALIYFFKMLYVNPYHPANFDFISRSYKKLKTN